MYRMRGFVGGIAQLGERLHGMQEVSGSIPLTSTNKQGSTMHKLGVITTLLGLILSIVGLAVGFGKMLNGSENAEVWISLIPLGFVGLFIGVTLTQLSNKQ